MIRLFIFLICMTCSLYGSAQVVGGRDNGEMSPKSVEASRLSAGGIVADVNILNGEYTSSVPLGSVSTPGGISWGLSLNYASSAAVGTVAPVASGIPYGEGWNLGVPVISVESESFHKYLQRQEDFQLYPCGTGTDSRFAMKYDAPASPGDPVDQFTGFDNSDIYWFAPQLNIPGVVSGRMIFKYYDASDNTLVFGLNTFESPVEIRMLNALQSNVNVSSWTVLLADGTKYWFDLLQNSYHAPSNTRVLSYDLCKPAANNAATIANPQNSVEGNYILNGVNIEKNVLNNILPKVANAVWYCTRITNSNIQNQQVDFEYDKFGRFNYFKEFSPENAANQNSTTGINNGMDNAIVGEFAAYKDILLRKVVSKVNNKEFEIMELDYKTLQTLITANSSRLIDFRQAGAGRMDSLYSYKTVYKRGGTGQGFSSWTRYAHVRAGDPITTQNLTVNPTNPYINSTTGSNYMRNTVSGTTINFSDGFLESERLPTGPDLMIPGDIYEVKTKIKNTRGTIDIALVTGDLGTTPFNSSGDYGNENYPATGAYPESKYKRSRGIELFSTFNMAFKWYRPLQNSSANPYNNELRTSNMFVMPNVPSGYKGFNIQVGPGNSDTDFQTPPEAMWQMLANPPYFKGKGSYCFMPLDNNNPVNFLMKSAAPIPHNFGIGYPWGIVTPLFERIEYVASSSPKSVFANWYMNGYTVGQNNGSWDKHRPTSLGKQDPDGQVEAYLAEIELVRYSKNPYMLQGVRVYRVNNGNVTNGKVLISQKQLEYKHIVKDLIENYDYFDYINNGSVPIKKDPARARVVVLLSNIRELPLNATLYADKYGLTDTTQVLTTFFRYTDINTTNIASTFEVRGEQIHVLSSVTDHLGGITTIEYKAVANANVTYSYDPQRSTFPEINNYSSYGKNKVYQVSVTVAKVNKQDESGLQTWTFAFSNPMKRHNQFLLNTNHFRNAFVQSISRGYKNVRVTKPPVNGVSSYTDIEHYGPLETQYGSGQGTDNILEFLCYGKVKSSKTYMNNILNSEDVYTYDYTLAFEHGAVRPSFKKNHKAYNPDMRSTYLYEDYYLPSGQFISLSGGLQPLKDYESTFNAATVNRKQPKMLEAHFFPDLLAANQNKQYMFHSYFVKLVSQSNKVYEEGLFRMPYISAAKPCYNIFGEVVPCPVVVIEPQSCSSALTTAQQSIETITEYSYYEADQWGRAQGTAYHTLFAVDPAKPKRIMYRSYGLGSGFKINTDILLKHEPSWQLAAKKVSSPQMPSASNREEYFYLYDQYNRYDRHWYLYDITNNTKFSVQVIGSDTMAVNNIQTNTSRPNNYSLPNYEGLESSRTYNTRSLAFQKTVFSKNASDARPLARSEYYQYDTNWDYPLSGTYQPPLLRFSAVQVDTLPATTASTYFRNYRIDRDNAYIADFLNVAATVVQPYGKYYTYSMLNPYDQLVVKRITQRNSLLFPEIVTNQSEVQTRYYYNTYVASNGNMTNLGLPERITTGHLRADSLSTRYEYNNQGLIKKLTEPSGRFLEYTYDQYLRLVKITENGSRLLSETAYNAWNHVGTLDFHQRTNQNYVLSTVYHSSEAGDKELLKAFVDPLGRENGSFRAHYMQGDTLFKIYSPSVTYDSWNRVNRVYKPYSETGISMNRTVNTSTAYADQLFENRVTGRSIKAADFGEAIASSAHVSTSEYKIVNAVVAYCELGLSNEDAKVMMISTQTGIGFYFYKTTVTDQDGKQTVTYTNAMGQVAAMATYTAAGTRAVTIFGYDSYGNLAKVLNPNRQTSTYLYNILGQLVLETTPDAGTKRYMYNKQGLVSVSQDEVERSRRSGTAPAPRYRVYKYDDYGRLLNTGLMNVELYHGEQRDPLTYQTTSISDPFFIYTFTNASTYDWLCSYMYVNEEPYTFRVTPSFFSISQPEKSYAYGSTPLNVGKLIREESYNNSGAKILKNEYSYDILGNITSQLVSFSKTNADSGADRIVSKIDYPAYNYSRSLLEQKVDVNNDGTPDLHLFYHYDRFNRLDSVRAAAGTAGSSAQASLLLSYAYDITGKLSGKQHYGSDNTGLDRLAMAFAYDYDVRERLTEMTAKNGTAVQAKYNLFYDAQLPAAGGLSVSSHQNWNGNINGTAMQYTFTNASEPVGNFSQPVVYGYEYDLMNRLVKADASVGDFISQHASEGPLIGDENYTYDKVGNLLSLKRYIRGFGAAFAQLEQWNYAYAAGTNRLNAVNGVASTPGRSYTYDANGNLLTDSYKGITQTQYGRSAYAYRINKGTDVIDYLYDTKDQRMFKKVDAVDNHFDTEEYYLQDISGRTVAIRKVAAAGTSWEYYIFGAEREMSVRPAANQQPGANASNTDVKIRFGQLSGFVYDHLGNTRVLYQPTAWNSTAGRADYLVSYAADFSPYGKILREYVRDEKAKYLTTQHERDGETGLDYRGARYYDSDIARFLSVDILVKKTMQSYQYTNGNPIRFIDPTGMISEDYIDINKKTGTFKITKREGQDIVRLVDNEKVVDSYEYGMNGSFYKDVQIKKRENTGYLVHFNDFNKADKFYQFAAKSDVEFGLVDVFYGNNLSGQTTLVTNGNKSSVDVSNYAYDVLEKYSDAYILYISHSHPGRFDPNTFYPAIPSGFNYDLQPNNRSGGDRQGYIRGNQYNERRPDFYNIYIPSKPEVKVQYNGSKVIRVF